MIKRISLFCIICGLYANVFGQTITNVKVTILSTMLSDLKGVGEWGFSALVEADSTKILFDTGGRPGLVRDNAIALNIDLSRIRQVILSHNHADHTSGLFSLREALGNTGSFTECYTGSNFFLREQIPVGLKKATDSVAYVKGGGKFIVVNQFTEIAPGIFLTGPVPRKYPEKNYPPGKTLTTTFGTVEDNVPEDMSMVIKTPKGLILLAGCGHAGIVNTMEFIQQRFPGQPIIAAIGGFHLLDTPEDKVEWTAAKIKAAGVQYLMGAHCTGINALYQLRQSTGLPKEQCVVGSVGSSFTLGKGIAMGWMR